MIGGLMLGGGAFLFFWWLHSQQDRGTWPRYVLCASVGGLALAGVGLLQIPSASPGAPTGAEYFGATAAAFFFGLAPGGGLVLGCLAALTESE